MLSAATVLGLVLLAFAGVVLLSPTKPSTSGLIWPALLATWGILGVGYSAVMTPSGRLLRRSAHAADRPAVFAAQFALSHACWLLTYPLAGWLGSSAGILPTLLVVCTENLNPEVVVVESAGDGARFYASGALNRANGRRIFVQRPMRSDVVIIACVRSQDPSQMGLTQNDDMIQALAANRSDQPFGEAVLPRRGWRGRFVPDA